MLRTLVRTTESFLSKFWEDETSQVTKTGVMSVASVLAVLAVAAIPQTAAAYYPCDGVCPNCWGTPCTTYCYCTDPQCVTLKVDCLGGIPGYVTTCTGGSTWCGKCAGCPL